MLYPIKVLCGTVSLLLLVYHFVIYPAFISPLSKVPNAHFTSSFSPLWMWWQRRGGRQAARAIHAAHQRHGPVVRLAPNELHVASVETLRQVFVGDFPKDKWYVRTFAAYGTPNLVSTLEHKPHLIRKRILTHVYNKSYVQTSPSLKILSKVLAFDRILPVLRSAAEAAAPVNVYDFNRAVGMDFVSAYLFGTASSTNYIQDLLAAEECFRNFRIESRTLPRTVEATTAAEGRCRSLCEAAEAWTQEQDRGSVPSPPSTAPVVYQRLSSSLAETALPPGRSKMDVVASEMFDHMFASHQTLAVAPTFLMWELSRCPDLQDDLRSELSTLSPSLVHGRASHGGVSEGEPRDLTLPTPSQIDALPLLNACIFEALRMYTASQGPVSRRTPPGATVGAYDNIPAGVKISGSAFCMHMNEFVFPDPFSFKPKRWLQTEGSEKGIGGTEEMRRWFWAFGSGERMCVGIHFALQGKVSLDVCP